MRTTPNHMRAINAAISHTEAQRRRAAEAKTLQRAAEETAPHVPFWQRDEAARHERETRLGYKDCTDYQRRLAKAHEVVAMVAEGASIDHARATVRYKHLDPVLQRLPHYRSRA